ncbi:MAG: hypothetical protein J5710_09805 [Treponema sp.]|nr:hypothetical protein [Treponema sp.]
MTKNPKLTEKMLVFLYCLSQMDSKVNINTFRRYIYLYYMTKAFFEDSETDDVVIAVEKGTVKILGFDDILNTLQLQDYIEIDGNFILINKSLKDYVEKLVLNGAVLFDIYKQINPFVNLLKSYDDQFIFTIFFSEPTYTRATQGAETEITPLQSQLSKLLKEFKKKIANDRIDNYDILSHWMDFILRNYYTATGEE